LGLAISLWDKQFFLSGEWRMELKKKFVSDFSKKKYLPMIGKLLLIHCPIKFDWS
jgi:hypothetical protein